MAIKTNIELLGQTTDHKGSFTSSATDPNQLLGQLPRIGLGSTGFCNKFAPSLG